MAKQRILVVEDTPNNLQLVSEVLQMNGYCVRGATSAEAGIRRAREEVPDLILMDINLPGMDGLEATRILKGLPETKDISIVALTSRAMKGDREKATQAGCSGYITKPISVKEFPQVVAGYLEEASTRENLRARGSLRSPSARFGGSSPPP